MSSRAPGPRAAIVLLCAGLLACASGGDRHSQPVSPSEEQAYSNAFAERAGFRQALETGCPQLPRVEGIIGQALQIGVPIFNAGSPLGCYRIYEGAGYKLLYAIGAECPELGSFLRVALARTETEPNVTERAWILRSAFDLVLGKPTRR